MDSTRPAGRPPASHVPMYTSIDGPPPARCIRDVGHVPPIWCAHADLLRLGQLPVCRAADRRVSDGREATTSSRHKAARQGLRHQRQHARSTPDEQRGCVGGWGSERLQTRGTKYRRSASERAQTVVSPTLMNFFPTICFQLTGQRVERLSSSTGRVN